MRNISVNILLILFYTVCVYSQSVSFKTYMNPIIPGDHPDPTLTKIGTDFYTSGSSFNPTPKIYHSTDLVHWEVIAQPVSASWSNYGDTPGGGIWGGHMVLFKGTYWHFFGKGGGNMYFVTANQPAGPWSAPVQLRVPTGMSGLGVDNSIFIDEETGKWYLLTKNGRENNHIVELDSQGQPTDTVLDLTWLNPDSEGNPYGWAEGPVMWKYKGYYYYSFAQHLAGSQYVMLSKTLTDDKSAWTIKGTNIFSGTTGTYNTPNHISPVILLDDSTSWTIAHSYNGDNKWIAQGRQGLLCRVTYDDQGFPVIQRPQDKAVEAPALPGSGISWTVPKSDMFNSSELGKEWSFMGYTPDNSWSLTDRPGWLYLKPYLADNAVIQNDGEHSYSLITRMEFDPTSTRHAAGLRIINGPQSHQAKVLYSINASGEKVFKFLITGGGDFEVKNTIGDIVWLKLIREEHMLSAYFSADGFDWNQLGETIDATDLDIEQSQFNSFTGNQQGLYVTGKGAYFDLYIYRDAYTPITAANPANRFGTSTLINRYPPNTLAGIHSGDWTLYSGVEFGNDNYNRIPDSLEITAASNQSGGAVEVWLDSIDTGRKIAECTIDNTGGFSEFQTFRTNVDSVKGSHDVYLRFTGAFETELFRINSFKFISDSLIGTSLKSTDNSESTRRFRLYQNFPNPFNPVTHIKYSVYGSSYINLKVYNILGQETITLFQGNRHQGTYTVTFDGSGLPGGLYLYQLKSQNYTETKKLMLLK